METKPYRLGLIGYPLKHSLSPRIHQAALEASGLPGEYRLYPVPPLPTGRADLQALLEDIQRSEIHGLNVTIPHKQSIVPLLDGLSPTANAIGAVNTVFLNESQLIGDNTDAPGFMEDLTRFTREVSPASHDTITPLNSALVLGAGGSARAVVYALAQAGWQVCIAARRIEQAKELIIDLSDSTTNTGQNNMSRGQLSFTRLEPTSIRDLTADISLIVNTTPLGMAPHIHTCVWPPSTPLPQSAIVYDLVYNPRDTELVRAARVAGLPATTGLGMLIEQAALAFERWTGSPAPRHAMWNAVNE